jgi:hypothetical protein
LNPIPNSTSISKEDN